MTTRRILQVMPFAAGGIARHVAQVTSAGENRGLSVDIAGPARLTFPLPKKHRPIEIPSGLFGHRAATRAIRGLLHNGYDVLHAHGLRAGIDAALAARGTDIPVVVTVHNLVLPETAGRLKAPLYARSESMALRLADRTIAVSNEIAEHLGRRVPSARSRIEVVYAGVGDPPEVQRDRDAVRGELGLSSERLIVSVARLSPQKDHATLLRAVALLPRDVVVALVGDGPLEGRLRRMAHDLEVDDRVRWLGFRRDVPDLVAAADVFVLSTIWDAVALSIQEAVLLGTPVVATGVGGIPELITDGRSGRLVPQRNPDALASALSDVLDSPELRSDLVKNARHDYDERFSIDTMMSELERIYEEVIGEA